MPVVTEFLTIIGSPRWGVALVTLCCEGLAQAQAGGDFAPQLELAAAVSPPVQRADTPPDSLVRLTVWSAPASQAGMGVGLGFSAAHQSLPEDARQSTAGLNLGLHWRSADQGLGQVRIGVWQQLSPWSYPQGIASQTNPPLNYNTRLEMQFSAASARGIQFELGGALGLQLNNNEKVVLRISRGRPMVYYRLKF